MIIAVASAILIFAYKSGFVTFSGLKTTTRSEPFEIDLLYYVPDNASIISVCGSGMRNIAKYRESPVLIELDRLISDSSRLYNLVGNFIPEGSKPYAKEISEKIAKIAGIIINSELSRSIIHIKEYVQYQSSDPGSEIPLNVSLAIMEKNIDYSADMNALIEAGLPIVMEEFEGYRFYEIDYSKIFAEYLAADKIELMRIEDFNTYFSFSENKMATSNSKEIIVKFYRGDKNEAKPALLEKPEFKSELAKLNEIAAISDCQGYMDFNQVMIDSLQNVEEDESLQLLELLKKSPLSSVMQSISYNKSLQMIQQWNFKDDSIPAEIKKWIAVAETSNKYDGIANLDNSSVFALAINGEVIKKLIEAIDNNSEASKTISASPNLEMISDLQNLSFSISTPALGIIWPEILLSIKHVKSKELFDLAKDLIFSGLNSYGMPITKWLEKDINGKSTSYFSTPFGIGLFLTDANSELIASSSESSIESYLSTDSKLSKTLNDLGIERIPTTLLEGYINMYGLLALAKNTQSSLAMFLPQDINIPADYEIIAKLIGHNYYSILLAPGSVTFSFHHKPYESNN